MEIVTHGKLRSVASFSSLFFCIIYVLNPASGGSGMPVLATVKDRRTIWDAFYKTLGKNFIIHTIEDVVIDMANCLKAERKAVGSCCRY